MLGRFLLTGLVVVFCGGMMAASTFTTVAEGQGSGIESPEKVVISTQAEWKALWARHAPGQPMPKVDFSRSMVLGVFLGTRNTGGFEVRITGVRHEGGSLLVAWQESSPPPDAIVTQMLTSPFHLVQTEKSDAKVEWRREDGSGK